MSELNPNRKKDKRLRKRGGAEEKKTQKIKGKALTEERQANSRGEKRKGNRGREMDELSRGSRSTRSSTAFFRGNKRLG